MADSDLSEVLDKLRSLETKMTTVERELSDVKLDQQRLPDTVANIFPAQKRAEFARVHELRFPEYDGKDDPGTWLLRCELFFRLQRTEEEDKVLLAAFHMTGEALSSWLQQNGGVVTATSATWPKFAESVRRRFGFGKPPRWLRI